MNHKPYPRPEPSETADDYRTRIVDWLIDEGFEPHDVLIEDVERKVRSHFGSAAHA